MKLLQGNNLPLLKLMPDNSVDSVVTDPPYGISFMGKKWDYDVPQVELWQEVLRVLKPGGHALVACGTRTQHRMAVNLEDAGFEIRDIVSWIYGSGFPKSHNIGKAVDKLQGNEREVTGQDQSGSKRNSMAGDFTGGKYDLTKGTSPWEGWGTALKPAMELWTLCRKPLSEKTIAENVLKWGTGGLNIDDTRIPTSDKNYYKTSDEIIASSDIIKVPNQIKRGGGNAHGRFPANLIHDGSEATKGMGDKARYFYTAKASKRERNEGLEGFEEKEKPLMGEFRDNPGRSTKKSSSVARANFHPTVKPVKLMQYLCRLITPPHGVVLDPFMGSGSTGIAAVKEGFDFIGIELDAEYVRIAEARIAYYLPPNDHKPKK